MKTCNLFIDNTPYHFNVEGDFFWGNDEVLYQQHLDILRNVPWKSKGYGIVEAFENEVFLQLQQSIKHVIYNTLIANGLSINFEVFRLTQYHKYVTTKALHNAVINVTRNLQVKDFNFNIDTLTERFGKILGYKLTSWVEALKKTHIQIRISRPNSLDINPPHRDGYLSYWHNIINVWLPIAGCNQKSSLPVCSGSHLFSENTILRTQNKGTKINGNTYHVPCILKLKSGDINMHRPNPKLGQALLFSPFLIHGAAVNQNPNTTRIALELRFPVVK